MCLLSKGQVVPRCEVVAPAVGCAKVVDSGQTEVFLLDGFDGQTEVFLLDGFDGDTELAASPDDRLPKRKAFPPSPRHYVEATTFKSASHCLLAWVSSSLRQRRT